VEDREKMSALIDGCLKNDRRSQEALFKLFYGKMLSVCMRYTADRDRAQEVLQEGFIKVFDKLAGFDYTGSFEGWLRRIITNTAIDSLRKAKRDPFLSENDNYFKFSDSNPMIAKEEVDLTELKAEIALQAVQRLSPAYRTVFNLYVVEEYTHKEIAAILGISEGTSKSNLAKAKIKLQFMLKEQFVKLV
jgi:RNA polymerase sigma-70 factor (ECF subfamily)